MSAEQLIMMVCYSDKYIRQYKVEIYLEYHMQCLSRRPNWDSPPPPPPSCKRVCPPRNQRGGGTLACGWGSGGSHQFGRLEKKLSTLSTLHVSDSFYGKKKMPLLFKNRQTGAYGAPQLPLKSWIGLAAASKLLLIHFTESQLAASICLRWQLPENQLGRREWRPQL
jgi:hypothetical protein